MNSELINQLQQLGINLGANGLPYKLPIHPILVHFTLGLFIIGIIFDLAGTFFALEKPILKFLDLPTLRSNFYTVGYYNVLASAGITFFTVTAAFLEIMLAQPPIDEKSAWGLGAGTTMILHGLGGVLLLFAIAAMTVWRGLQRYRWRKGKSREVVWSYLLIGVGILGFMYVHGTLGAHLGGDFGFHNTAGNLLKEGLNPNILLKENL
ncbi:DUF2231 domain-containing protein [Pleurocapsa sp. FMAR1]|uniref:DUF2231 domain-containing protein n=1 Tax=Pleurocapsa sp. FMAR1 TaxID=3040204 RepID=UPI0029C6D9DC|nr:DUF2231 domain-containing protein [Pleurocapsa sp. FMAR1]